MKVVTSSLLSQVQGVRHSFFTRDGGVSRGLYDSLNVGRGSKDDPAHVEENRARAAAYLGASAEQLLTCYQIHSADALVAQQPFGDERPEGDAIATAIPGLVCGALSADCAPILIADPEARVVASAHAGWKGALGGVVEAAVEAMTTLGAERSRMVAAIGPCIGPKSYEVGLEYLDRFVAADPYNERFFRPGVDAEKRLFDLPAYVLHRLNGAGVNRAEWIGCDTLADERFFSNRRAFLSGDSDYGRFLSAIVLEG